MRHMNPSTVAEVDRALARLRARLEAFPRHQQNLAAEMSAARGKALMPSESFGCAM